MTVQVQEKIAATAEVIAANERFRRKALADLKRIRIAEAADALHWSSQHDPVEDVKVKISGTRMQQRGVRRKADARVAELLTPDLERAADLICAAHRILSEGMGGGIMRYDLPTAKAAADAGESAELYRQKLVDRYIEWGRACGDNGVQCGAVMQIIAYGHGLRAVDVGCRKRSGWSKDNLLSGLDLYCCLFRIR